jgi:hypothetical protein
MRPAPNEALERLRHRELEIDIVGRAATGTNNGCFMAIYQGMVLRMISGVGKGWEHVSVSLERRMPNWREMCFVKDLFWLPEEAVMQLHPPESSYVNNHPNCLHLWRPLKQDIPLPPPDMVGVKDAGVVRGRAHADEVRSKYFEA